MCFLKHASRALNVSAELADPTRIHGRSFSLLLAGESSLAQNDLVPLARVVATHEVGCDPTIMGIGPADAIRGALQKAGLTLADMDLVEVSSDLSVSLKNSPASCIIWEPPSYKGEPLPNKVETALEHEQPEQNNSSKLIPQAKFASLTPKVV